MRWLRPQLAAARRGLKAVFVAFGREVGMLEVAILAIAAGAFLLAREYLAVTPAYGVAMIVGGGLSLLSRFAVDALAVRRERGPQR